jgi:Transposase zinc-binding domain
VARGGLEVADVFRHFGPAFRDQHGASLSSAQRHAMTAIESCRTAALGGHVKQCGDCGHQRILFNSCRNRNCPKCQGLARAWARCMTDFAGTKCIPGRPAASQIASASSQI